MGLHLVPEGAQSAVKHHSCEAMSRRLSLISALRSSSRGIGLEMTRQSLRSLWHTVFASCRSPSTAAELRSLTSSNPGKLHVIKLDVTDEESIKPGTAKVLRILDGSLDYVINNVVIVFLCFRCEIWCVDLNRVNSFSQ